MTTAVKALIVAKEEEDMRLDRWFKKHFPSINYGHLQKLFRTGQVRVAGKRAKAETRLAEGQEIRIPPLFENDAKPKPAVKLQAKDIEFIRSLVIYKDDDIIAINKPPGIAVQGGSKISRHIDGLLDGLKDKETDERPKLVHRLDKETSGVMLLARNTKAARVLSEAFHDREIRKYYWAITVGVPELFKGVIKAPIAKAEGPGGERMMVMDDDDGKKAYTIYSVMDRAGKSAAWVAFWPKTGRTHQIRIHASVMGTPLLGDVKYGGEEGAFIEGEPNISKDIHLHARRLIMQHPFKGKKTIDITAPLHNAMKKTWKYFNFDTNDSSDPFEDID